MHELQLYRAAVIQFIIQPQAEAVVVIITARHAMIAAIGLTILAIKKVPVGDMLPALLIALAAGWILG